jgi:hypothetical protein
MFHCFCRCVGADAVLSLVRDMGAPPSPASMNGENLVFKAVSQGFEEWISQKLLDFQQRVKASVAKTPTGRSASIRIAEEKRSPCLAMQLPQMDILCEPKKLVYLVKILFPARGARKLHPLLGAGKIVPRVPAGKKRHHHFEEKSLPHIVMLPLKATCCAQNCWLNNVCFKVSATEGRVSVSRRRRVPALVRVATR